MRWIYTFVGYVFEGEEIIDWRSDMKEKIEAYWQEISFGKLVLTWLVCAGVLNVINYFVIQSAVLFSFLWSTLGIVLMIRPVWPKWLENIYAQEANCKRMTRIFGLIVILLSFSVQMKF